jgi:hypothetical protein
MGSSNEDRIRQFRMKKENAEAAGDFNAAAKLRDEERKLLKDAGGSLSEDSVATRVDKVNGGILQKNVVGLIFFCLFLLCLLYNLFVNKVMCGEFDGCMHVDSNDILFWIYAAALATPVVLVFIFIISTRKRSGNKDNNQSLR